MSHYAETNLQTADYRLYTQRPQQPSRETRIRLLERYLGEMQAFSWTEQYQSRAAELAALREEAR